ncbi:hypothetical protein GCM10026982_30120 [Nocardiopsis aegyptia]
MSFVAILATSRSGLSPLSWPNHERLNPLPVARYWLVTWGGLPVTAGVGLPAAAKGEVRGRSRTPMGTRHGRAGVPRTRSHRSPP